VRLKDEGVTTKGLAEPAWVAKKKEITDPKRTRTSFLNTLETPKIVRQTIF